MIQWRIEGLKQVLVFRAIKNSMPFDEYSHRFNVLNNVWLRCDMELRTRKFYME
jgi:hypothetical protein